MIVNVLIEFWLSESDISSGSRYLYNPPRQLSHAGHPFGLLSGRKEYSSPAFLRTREALKRPLYRFLREASACCGLWSRRNRSNRSRIYGLHTLCRGVKKILVSHTHCAGFKSHVSSSRECSILPLPDETLFRIVLQARTERS